MKEEDLFEVFQTTFILPLFAIEPCLKSIVIFLFFRSEKCLLAVLQTVEMDMAAAHILQVFQFIISQKTNQNCWGNGTELYAEKILIQLPCQGQSFAQNISDLQIISLIHRTVCLPDAMENFHGEDSNLTRYHQYSIFLLIFFTSLRKNDQLDVPMLSSVEMLA